MKARLSLAFPYLVALLVVGIMFWGGSRSSITVLDGEEALQTAQKQQDAGIAICPLCQMEVELATAQFTTQHEGQTIYFCSQYCLDNFDPATMTGDADGMRPVEQMPQESHGAHVDPVCGMEVDTAIESKYNGRSYYFCTDLCRKKFNADPEHYLAEVCLVCQAEGDYTPLAGVETFETTWEGKTYAFCSAEHREKFLSDPAGYFMHTMWGIPNWLYYCSIGLILLLSFGIIEWREAHAKSGAAEDANRPKTPPARIDLLKMSWLRRLLKSQFTRPLAQIAITTFFLIIIATGLFGNQLSSKNVAPLLTWTIWWGGLVMLILYAGKVWCYACPWDAIAEWSEGLRIFGKRKEGLSLKLKWPRFMRNIWPATVLFIGLTWIELCFDVTINPRATAYLALTILALAFVSAFVFDRKSFCRYGCLVGRISGLYALFSPVEIRARDQEKCRSCKTISCYKGNEHGAPCPTFQNVAQMDQNTYCIMCMECVKTCEKGNIALNLRPWGEDLAHHHRPRSDEAYLALLMLSLTGFHGLTMTGAWQQIVDWISQTAGLGESAAFTVGMTALMVAPALLYGALVAVSRWAAREPTVTYRQYFIRYAYALLPIALFYHLAHNSEHLLMEGQKVIALLSDPLGQEWNILGTTDWSLEPLINLPTLWIIQVLFVLIGHVFSLWTARRAAGALFSDSKAALRSQIPMLIAMILFSLMSLWLLKQPMEMRTSAM